MTTLSLIEALILAIVQGLTEWLPVSSTGHLNLVRNYLGVGKEEPSLIFFDFILHIGTLCVVLIAFRKEIVKILKAVARLDFKTDEGKMALLIVVGSIPTALIGFIFIFLFHNLYEPVYHHPLTVGVALPITGFFLYTSKHTKRSKELNYLDSLLIGIAQGIAIIPGISRSGLTIASGLLRKVERKTAFTYSFLLSVPAVIGASILEFTRMCASNELAIGGVDIATMFFGVVVSMIIGYVSLKLLRKLVMREKFHLFAYYCWIAGIVIILYHSFL